MDLKTLANLIRSDAKRRGNVKKYLWGGVATFHYYLESETTLSGNQVSLHFCH